MSLRCNISHASRLLITINILPHTVVYTVYLAYIISARLLYSFQYFLTPTGTANLPTGTDIAVIVPGATETQQFEYNLDVQLQLRGGGLKSINSLHRLYDPLSYALLYPEGNNGYHLALSLQQPNGLKGITATDFYRYHLQIRDTATHFNLFLRGGTYFI